MAWDVLTSADYGADVILTEATATALYDNPRAMAQRESSTPSLVQVPVRAYYVTGTGATWTIPSGVTAFNVIVQGGGGGSGGAGGASTVTYNSVTYTGNGGAQGVNGAAVAGGTASGGDLNIKGQDGVGSAATVAGSSMFGHGGLAISGTDITSNGTGCGSGGALSTNAGPTSLAGAAGGTCYKRIVVVGGQTTATYTVGAAGTGTATGGSGLVIFEY